SGESEADSSRFLSGRGYGELGDRLTGEAASGCGVRMQEAEPGVWVDNVTGEFETCVEGRVRVSGKVHVGDHGDVPPGGVGDQVCELLPGVVGAGTVRAGSCEFRIGPCLQPPPLVVGQV